jgi:hypothetical protein
MNRLSRIATAGVCLFMCGTLSAGEIDQGLEEVFELSEPGEVISTLVYLWEQADIQALQAQHDAERKPFAQRNEEVVKALRETAELTQAALLEDWPSDVQPVRSRVSSRSGSPTLSAWTPPNR